MTTLLSVVVPTRNRADFVRRLLQYHVDQRIDCALIIADDGDEQSRDENAKSVAAAASKIQVEFRPFDQPVDLATKIGLVLNGIETEFTALGADDDFFAAQGLEQACKWLQANPDYSIAHGTSWVFEVAGGGVHGRLNDLQPYRQASLHQPTATQRFLAHLAGYATTWYSVGRTSQLRSNWERSYSLDPNCLGEFVPSLLGISMGKAKCLPQTYMLRQSHNRRVSVQHGRDWLSTRGTPAFDDQLARAKHCLADCIARVDDLPSSFVEQLVNSALDEFIEMRAQRAMRQRENRERTSRLAAVPFAKALYHDLLAKRRRRALTSHTLLDPHSTAGRDFKPIHEAIASSSSTSDFSDLV